MDLNAQRAKLQDIANDRTQAWATAMMQFQQAPLNKAHQDAVLQLTHEMCASVVDLLANARAALIVERQKRAAAAAQSGPGNWGNDALSRLTSGGSSGKGSVPQQQQVSRLNGAPKATTHQPHRASATVPDVVHPKVDTPILNKFFAMDKRAKYKHLAHHADDPVEEAEAVSLDGNDEDEDEEDDEDYEEGNDEMFGFVEPDPPTDEDGDDGDDQQMDEVDLDAPPLPPQPQQKKKAAAPAPQRTATSSSSRPAAPASTRAPAPAAPQAKRQVSRAVRGDGDNNFYDLNTDRKVERLAQKLARTFLEKALTKYLGVSNNIKTKLAFLIIRYGMTPAEQKMLSVFAAAMVKVLDEKKVHKINPVVKTFVDKLHEASKSREKNEDEVSSIIKRGMLMAGKEPALAMNHYSRLLWFFQDPTRILSTALVAQERSINPFVDAELAKTEEHAFVVNYDEERGTVASASETEACAQVDVLPEVAHDVYYVERLKVQPLKYRLVKDPHTGKHICLPRTYAQSGLHQATEISYVRRYYASTDPNTGETSYKYTTKIAPHTRPTDAKGNKLFLAWNDATDRKLLLEAIDGDAPSGDGEEAGQQQDTAEAEPAESNNHDGEQAQDPPKEQQPASVEKKAVAQKPKAEDKKEAVASKPAPAAATAPAASKKRGAPEPAPEPAAAATVGRKRGAPEPSPSEDDSKKKVKTTPSAAAAPVPAPAPVVEPQPQEDNAGEEEGDEEEKSGVLPFADETQNPDEGEENEDEDEGGFNEE